MRLVTRSFVLLSSTLWLSTVAPTHAQVYVTSSPDWVYRREWRDLQGQSYTDIIPRGRGYFTPL